MITKYLDNIGLAYFWSKIKSYIAELLVSKADNSTVVHNTGNETIAGTKAFSSEVKMSSSNALRIKSSDYGVIFRNDNNAFYLLVTASGDADGTWTTARPLTVNLSNGNCSINGTAAIASAVAWSGVTNKPTTISGYGITDAKIDNGVITLGSNSITPLTSHQTLPTLSRTISGSGNAITDITVSGHAITATKGATYITSSGSITGNAATATDASRLKSFIPTSTAYKVTFTSGPLELGTSAGNAYVGSSNNVQLISIPENGTTITQTYANAQNLRFIWNGNYFSDIFVSPNNRYVWHRDIANKFAYPWRRLVEENTDGITAPNWNISIAGNATTATKASKDDLGNIISSTYSKKPVKHKNIISSTVNSNTAVTVATHTLNSDGLIVFVNGVECDFTDYSTTQVKFSFGLNAGDVVSSISFG